MPLKLVFMHLERETEKAEQKKTSHTVIVKGIN